MSDYNWIIAVKLAPTFNAKAADVTAVLKKYNAHLGKAGLFGPSVDVAYGVAEKDEAAFIKEFEALSGVKSVHKQISPC
jgi:hypothetical protein